MEGNFSDKIYSQTLALGLCEKLEGGENSDQVVGRGCANPQPAVVNVERS